MVTDIDRVSDPAYLAGLAELPIDEVRAKRQECQDLENALSYVRRLVHGRLDIVRGELEHRAAGGAPEQLSEIISRLPELLSDGSRSPGLPRPPQDFEPGAFADDLVDDLDEAFPVSIIASLPERSDPELVALVEGLRDHERRVSEGRNRLHEVIDELHNEIIERYRSGDASIDTIL